VVTQVLIDQELHRFRHRCGVDPVELNTARGFRFVVLDQTHACRGTFDERARGNHFRDVKAGTVFPAQSAKSGVGNTGHRGQHHGDAQLKRPDG